MSMHVEEVTQEVDAITQYQWDDERAHSAEDDLMQAWIRAEAPPDVLAEFERLWKLPFARWCA